MGPTVAINQIINKYYDLYRENEITFTKEILKQLRLDPRQIYVKCAGSQWPCIVNSTSFQMAKIIIGTQGGCFQQITKKEAPPVNLRYCFIDENNQPIYFFVSCHVTDVTPYMNSKELAVITLTFTQRPPDDLILKLGTLLDANANFMRRKDERIILNENTKRALGIAKKESIIYIQNVPRRCILWDISFSGTKIIIMGLPNFLKGKDCIIRFMFADPNEIIDVKGTIVQADAVEGRRDLATAGINFDENQVPLQYKIRINEYLSNNKKTFLNAAQGAGNADPTKIIVDAKKAQEAKEAEEKKTTNPVLLRAQKLEAEKKAQEAADAKKVLDEAKEKAEGKTEVPKAPEAEKKDEQKSDGKAEEKQQTAASPETEGKAAAAPEKTESVEKQAQEQKAPAESSAK